MKTLDLNINFGFYDGGDAEDFAEGVEFSDELYEWIKDTYLECGEEQLNDMCDFEDIPSKLQKELIKILKDLREDVIDNQRSNGDDCDPETGEEYDWDEAYVLFYVDVPDEWEEDED